VLTCLNDAIVGYHHATNSLFGGAPIERLVRQRGLLIGGDTAAAGFEVDAQAV
jgi:hypothetical protein